MTYDVKDLHGVWVNLDDDSLLRLEEGGDFKLTPSDDSSVTVARGINVIGISGRWAVEDGKFKLSVDLRSMRLSSTSRLMAIGAAIFSILLRLVKERKIVYGEITRLTGTDLWIENSQGNITKFQKK